MIPTVHVRPVDWPSPYSRAGRFLGWVHFLASAGWGWLLSVSGLACYAVGIVAGLVVVVAAVPVVAVAGLGFILRSQARRVLSC